MPREWRFYVYIMASKSRRIYTGVTNNIDRRVAQHKRGEIEGFTQGYKINRLVYLEKYQYVQTAIRREKQIKGWDRVRRVALIERENPTWDDLATENGVSPSCRSSLSLPKGKQIPRSPPPHGSAKAALRGGPGRGDLVITTRKVLY
jgi:putative endonuclease